MLPSMPLLYTIVPSLYIPACYYLLDPNSVIQYNPILWCCSLLFMFATRHCRGCRFAVPTLIIIVVLLLLLLLDARRTWLLTRPRS